MAKISHYEVYADTGDGWKLLGRFPEDERVHAFNMAKDKAMEKVAVKVIKEVFDSLDGSYFESVEFVKGLKTVRGKKNLPRGYTASSRRIPQRKHGPQKTLKKKGQGAPQKRVKEKLNYSKVMQAAGILIAIIVGSAVVVNILGALLLPLLEMFLPENVVRSVYFMGLFALFVAIALPLMLKKVPWGDLSSTSIEVDDVEKEEVFYKKAESIITRYNLNEDFADDKTPIAPAANVPERREIVGFLAQLLSSLSDVKLNNFNKLGVKLMSYGGILEYAQHKNFSSSQVNSLLQEVIKVVDGEETDLVEFYEAKRSYKDTNQALYLTGLGAFMMDKYLSDKTMDKNVLSQGFNKWRQLGKDIEEVEKKDDKIAKHPINVSNIVSIKYNVKFFDTSLAEGEDPEAEQLNAIHNIFEDNFAKFHGNVFSFAEGQLSYIFDDLVLGVAFAKQVATEIKDYIYDLSDDNIIFNVRMNMIKHQTNNDNQMYINDVFEYVNNDEIITTYNLVEEAKEKTNLNFKSVGHKILTQSSKRVELFKIL